MLPAHGTHLVQPGGGQEGEPHGDWAEIARGLDTAADHAGRRPYEERKHRTQFVLRQNAVAFARQAGIVDRRIVHLDQVALKIATAAWYLEKCRTT